MILKNGQNFGQNLWPKTGPKLAGGVLRAWAAPQRVCDV
jgi:hypothetical protein